MFAASHNSAVESISPHRADARPPVIQPLRMQSMKPSHACAEVGGVCLHQQVMVGGKEAVRENVPSQGVDRGREEGEEAAARGVIRERIGPFNRVTSHMMDEPCAFDPRSSRHRSSVTVGVLER
jgi:hypothetical protein